MGAIKILPPMEEEIFQHTLLLNQRGLPMDTKSVKNVIEFVARRKEELKLQVQELTNGEINSTSQTAKVMMWLKDKGLALPNLQKGTVSEVMKGDIPDEARKMLNLRQEMSLSSVSKYTAMDKFVCPDGRLRGAIRYHIAATGRFGGAGIQPQNMPSRGIFSGSLLEEAHKIIRDGDYDEFKLWFGQDFGKALKSCIRGMICTDDDNVFISSDYSSVEAVGLAWVAGEQYVLDEFAAGKCLYRVAGAKMYNKPYEEVTKKTEERANGKISVLACGYQGALGALKAFNPDIEDEFGKKIVADWRSANPKCVEFWAAMDYCSKQAVKTGRVQKYRDITWLTSGDFLLCRLPSGRHLHYYKPFLKKKMMPWGKASTLLHFWGLKQKSFNGKVGQKKWQVCETYGGKLTENIVQALCRDLLCHAIVTLESNGYPIVLHVHDEVMAELPKGTNKTVEELESIMGQKPAWAKGFPLRASGGWIGRRFRK